MTGKTVRRDQEDKAVGENQNACKEVEGVRDEPHLNFVHATSLK